MGETPSALTDSEFIGESLYNGLQVTLRRQIARGLSFQSAYTLSKAMNNTSVYNDLDYLSRNWARATFDRTHRIVTNFDYQLPNSVHNSAAAGKLLNGWSTTGIVILQSGLPLTLTDPNGGAVYGEASPSTVTLCPGRTVTSLATSGSLEARLGGWINTSALCSPPAIGSDGATGYGNAGQSLLDGPPQVNTDFSLGKRTVVGGLRENAELAFRVEFYNSLNHPQFSEPGHYVWDGKLRGNHPNLGRPSPDTVRIEIPLLTAVLFLAEASRAPQRWSGGKQQQRQGLANCPSRG